MNSALLELLKPLVAEYEQQASSADLVAAPLAFSMWLQVRLAPQPLVPPTQPATGTMASEHRQISGLLSFLYRHWRRFARLALRDVPRLYLPSDYDYLATLHTQGNLGRQELIAANRHHTGAGLKIINRLLAYELIAEQPSLDTPGRHVLALTHDGCQLLAWGIRPMSQANALLLGNLTAAERHHLYHLLSKLEIHHQVAPTLTPSGVADQYQKDVHCLPPELITPPV